MKDEGDLLQFLYQAPVGLMQTDLEGTIEFCTPMAVQLLMPVTPGGILTNVFDAFDRVAPELRNWVIGFEKKRGRVVTEHRCPIVASDGGVGAVLGVTIVKLSKTRLAISVCDITEFVQREREAIVNRQMLSEIGRIVSGGEVHAVDEAGRVTGWTDTSERLHGFSAEDMVGRPFGVLVVGEDLREYRGGSLSDEDRDLGPDTLALLEAAKRHGSATREGLLRRKSGETFWAETTVARLVGQDGAPAGYTVVTRETGEERERDRALMRLATTDPLTGLPNRRGFIERAQAAMQGAGGRFAVCVADLDRFKLLNDTFGHATGDEALKAFATAVAPRLSPGDAIGRLGGEEFAILFSGVSPDEAVARADALRAAVEGIRLPPPTPDGDGIAFTVSIGVAAPRAPDDALGALLDRADRALYRAKAGGRNRVVRADAEGPLVA